MKHATSEPKRVNRISLADKKNDSFLSLDIKNVCIIKTKVCKLRRCSELFLVKDDNEGK